MLWQLQGSLSLQSLCGVSLHPSRLELSRGLSSIWQIYQNRYILKNSIVNPGLIYINPCTDTLLKVDCKVQMIDCPRQMVMTKDNILVSIDATVYYRVVMPRKSVFYIDNLHQAVTQLTLATIKSIAGSHTLQDLLEERAEVQKQIEGFVDEHVWEWGIDVENMLIKDIQLNADLQNTLSMAAKEQRAAQAKVISAQGDVQSAKLMRQAAELLFKGSNVNQILRHNHSIGIDGINQSGTTAHRKQMILYSNEHYNNNNRNHKYSTLRSRETWITRTISSIPKECIPTLGITFQFII